MSISPTSGSGSSNQNPLTPPSSPSAAGNAYSEWSDPQASLSWAQQLVANTQQYQAQLQIAQSADASSPQGQTAMAYVQAYHSAQVFLSTYNQAQRISTTSAWYKMVAPYVERTMKDPTTGKPPSPDIIKLMVYEFIYNAEMETNRYIKKITDRQHEINQKWQQGDEDISGTA